jgi:hypothetical protein
VAACDSFIRRSCKGNTKDKEADIFTKIERESWGNNENCYGRKVRRREIPQRLPTKTVLAPSEWGDRK